MRGATYYASTDIVKLYSSPAVGTVVATLSKNDEAGVSTGNLVKDSAGDLFIELIRLSDQRKLYALESDVSMNPAVGGNTLPDVTVTAKRLSTSVGTKLQAQIKQRPVLAYASLGLLLVGIGTLAAKLK